MALGVTLLQGFDVRWMEFWYLWIVILGIASLFYWTQRRTHVSAGAQWLQKRGRKWVCTYELTKVTACAGLSTMYLSLTDHDGRKVRVKSDDLQEDRYLWDLVYDGIVHSVILGGARTNALLHRAFDVPRPKNSVTMGVPDGRTTLDSTAREKAYSLHTDAAGRRTLVRSRGVWTLRPMYVGIILGLLGFGWLGFSWLALEYVADYRTLQAIVALGPWNFLIGFAVAFLGAWMIQRAR